MKQELVPEAVAANFELLQARIDSLDARLLDSQIRLAAADVLISCLVRTSSTNLLFLRELRAAIDSPVYDEKPTALQIRERLIRLHELFSSTDRPAPECPEETG